MKENLKKLKENSVLTLVSSWGLRSPGESKIIITKDKKIYKYTKYYKETYFIKKNNIPLESLSQECVIKDRDYKKIIKFIKKEILMKNYESALIFDASFKVSGVYDGKTFEYFNCFDVKTNEDLYRKTYEFIVDIINKRKDN